MTSIFTAILYAPVGVAFAEGISLCHYTVILAIHLYCLNFRKENVFSQLPPGLLLEGHCQCTSYLGGWFGQSIHITRILLHTH